MQQNSVSPSYAAAELQAREHRSNHDFREAARQRRRPRKLPAAEGDMVVVVEHDVLPGREPPGRRRTLKRAPKWPPRWSMARARRPNATASGAGPISCWPRPAGRWAAGTGRRRGPGSCGPRVDEPDVEIDVKARQALIAALADSGRLDEAWAESLVLADVISAEVDDQLVGKAYWVIGNVAFLCNNVQEGLHYHELAAATFSPARNLDVWAKFNKASAAMRLAADVADADTLRCIERAELATDVIGGSANDFLLLKLNRGHWNFLAGDPAAAIEFLRAFARTQDKTSPQILGEACLLLGRAHAAMGNQAAAREHLLEAADHFERAGAPQRADQAREFLTGRILSACARAVAGHGPLAA